MYLKHRRAVVALLVSAALAVPGAALAKEPAKEPTEEAAPAPTEATPAPTEATPAPTEAAPAPTEAAPAPTEAVPAPPEAVTEPTKGAPQEASVDPQNFKVSRDEAISIATRMFSIPSDLGAPNVSASDSKEGAMWQLQYRTPGNKSPHVNISVGIDAQSGAVLSYSRSVNDPGKEPAPLSYTRAQALEKANFWLDMLSAALKPSLRAMENPMHYGYYGANATYDFHWERMAEGYPVRSDNISIAIDARTGELASFNRGRWNATAFNLPATMIDKEKAEAAYRSQVPMGLQYQYYHKPGTDTGDWKLVYRPDTGNYPSMNQEGKLIDYNGQPLTLDFLAEMKLVPASDKPYQAPAKPLSREEALPLAKAAAGLTDEPSGANYTEEGAEQKTRTWNFSWQSTGDKGGASTNVAVDVDRGVITSYNSWRPQETLRENEQPNYTEAQGREAAIAFIRSYRPDLAGKIMIMPSDESRLPEVKARIPRQSYYVQFTYLKNGIRIADSQLSVDVDAMTGKVRSYWASELSEQQPFPAATGLIKPEAAMDAFLKSQGLEAAWAELWQPAAPDKEMQNSPPELLWMPGATLNVAAIDAKTGAPLDYEARDLLQQGKRPTDIDGHVAEREIELLWFRGVLDVKDGKFSPDQQATAGDIARWLVLARGMQPYLSYDFDMAFRGGAGAALAQSAAAPYFGAALQSGIILPEDFGVDTDPAAPVSRELFALWGARAMGYASVARMPNRIDMPFADQAKIGAKHANAVALLHGLGVVKGDKQTNFEPQRALTRGEAAMYLFAVASEPRH